MPRILTAVLVVLFAAGCGKKAVELPPCDLNIDALSGDFVSLKGGGQGADVPDKFARVRFFEEGGKKKAVYTAGQIAPGNPATNKYTYERVDKTSQGDVLYSINLFEGKSNQRIERLKKDNRRLDTKFEGRLYVKVDEKTCRLTISDMYVTYDRGKEIVDSNPTGTRAFVRLSANTPELGFVHCNEMRQVYPFAAEVVDFDKDQPLDPQKGVYKGEPVWMHFVPEVFEGTPEEIAARKVKTGVVAEPGMSYEMELWVGDNKAAGPTAVTPDEQGNLKWAQQYTFTQAPVDGLYTELIRYKKGADGKRVLIGNACNVVAPEQERTAEEKAAAEEAAAKAADK